MAVRGAPLMDTKLPKDRLPPRAEQLYYGRPEPTLGESTSVAYLPDEDLLAAANAALLLEAPLLLTGDPGCGKSQFAWAAARALSERAPDQGRKREPHVCQIRSDSRARDLLYRYDAVRRFGDAQAGGDAGKKNSQDPRHYVDLMPLGLALVSSVRSVVLLDEIDKAPRDLPNDLLNELDAGDFHIAELAHSPELTQADAPVKSHGVALQERMVRPAGVKRPLVIITSNAERQLPDAFLRRCVFFHIPFPDRAMLEAIIKVHCPKVEATFLDCVLTVFQALRELQPALRKPPGTAELLHFVRALGYAYPAEQVGAVMVFAALLKKATEAVRWPRLPGLGCLVKLWEDQQRLQAGV